MVVQLTLELWQTYYINEKNNRNGNRASDLHVKLLIWLKESHIIIIVQGAKWTQLDLVEYYGADESE